ncbi:MAG TPA: ATP-dependent DNA ligase [Candidatus Dormibacteraeota bacterium]|jgi:DNA ligase-1|nr:ATP-dependent DNA ligase [Candidatus Dormibacteraeota bacterium]
MRRFAEVAEAIGATSSKLEKVRLLGDYLAALDEQRLPVATRFFAGRVFPPSDPRVLQVGGAALSAVLRELGGVDNEDLSSIWRKYADSGETTQEVFRRAGRTTSSDTDILDVVAAFDEIASISGARARTRAVSDLLARCDPLEAKYVTKLMAGDMRIGLREGLVEEAIGAAFSRPRAAVERANMVTGDLGEVALLALHDELESAQPRLFSPLRFMLASPVADAAEVIARLGAEVWVEDKYDGIRCQLHRDEHRVALFSRDLNDVTQQFPEVAGAARELPGSLLLDGELLAFRDGRVRSFFELQTRLGRKSPPQSVIDAVPVIFTAWDILYQDGESLLDHPLRERRHRLDDLHLGGRFATAHQERASGVEQLEQLFIDARERHNEGLLAKDPDSAYTPGRRGLAWLKLKKPLDTLDVVVVGAEWGHGKRRDVLSDVTFAVRVDDSDELVPIGKAYSGLTDAEIDTMTKMLLDRTLQDRGHYRSVVPDIVLEVAFDSVQPSTRHRSGYALRFPRIVNWRHDKPASEIDTLSRVRQIAESLIEEREQLVDRAGNPTAEPAG